MVGRISAQIDTAFNEFHDNAWGMFGFLELEDDVEVMRALLDAAAAWLRERGRDRMVGPMDFTMNDESGVLIEGFEREPMIRQAWHPPYYQRLCEEAGLEKAVDTFMWSLHISGPRERDADHLGARRPARAEARHPDPQDEPPDSCGASSTRSRRSTTRPGRATGASCRTRRADLDAYAQELQLVYDRDWFMVAEDGRREDGRDGDHRARTSTRC